MFDLEQRIDQWKTELTRTEAMRAGDVAELEQHVRDSIAALAAKGLTMDEAFVVATHRVGAPAALGREFAKVNGHQIWTQRVFWMVAGGVGYIVCRAVIGAIASASQVLVASAGGGGLAIAYTAAVVTAGAWISVTVALWRQANARARRPLLTRARPGAMGTVLVMALVVAGLVTFGSQLLLTRLAPGSFLTQEMMLARSAANGMATLLLPLVLIALMLALRRRMHEDSRFERT